VTLNGAGGTSGQQHSNSEVVLRIWRMPLIAAALCVSVWPLTGAVLLVPVFAVIGWDSPSADVVLGGTAALFWLGGILCAVRAVAARVVLTPDQLRLHNVLSTVRVSWTDVAAVEEASFLNASGLSNTIWHGTAIRVRSRRRPVRVLASWHPDVPAGRPSLADAARSAVGSAGADDGVGCLAPTFVTRDPRGPDLNGCRAPWA
jgi:hypothetical protein